MMYHLIHVKLSHNLQSKLIAKKVNKCLLFANFCIIIEVRGDENERYYQKRSTYTRIYFRIH
jgi:hypothetical protein